MSARNANIMSNSTRKLLTVTLLSLSLAGVASAALAETRWEKNHPRRDQVNDRLARQNARIKQEVKEGDLTKSQAAALHPSCRETPRWESRSPVSPPESPA